MRVLESGRLSIVGHGALQDGLRPREPSGCSLELAPRGERLPPSYPSDCTSEPDSTGGAAQVSAEGNASIAAGEPTLGAEPVPDQFGVFFHAANPTQVPFGNGFRCAHGAVQRGAIVLAAGQLTTYVYDDSDARHSLAGYADRQRHFQCGLRDPAAR